MSLHNHKQKVSSRSESTAKKELSQKDVKIGATFTDGSKEVAVPQALIDLVHALNPRDDKHREAITDALFPKKGDGHEL